MKTCVIFISLSLISLAEQKILWDTDSRNNETEQIELWEANLEKSATMEGIDKINFLSLGLKNMGYRKNMTDHANGVDRVYQMIQDEMLAISGHATYYGDRINKAQAERRAAMDAAKGDELGSANYGIKSSAFRNEETDGLEILRHLPSPETVGVLGNFLSDEWVNPIPVQDDKLWPSLARHSVEMLAVMPIVKKPTARIEDPANPGVIMPDLKAWQQWFEQIKAGKRTFRFEGDPTEYDLNGPAPKETLERIERDLKRDAERQARNRKSSAVSDFVSEGLKFSDPSSIARLVAALALISAAVWYFLRGRKAA